MHAKCPCTHHCLTSDIKAFCIRDFQLALSPESELRIKTQGCHTCSAKALSRSNSMSSTGSW